MLQSRCGPPSSLRRLAEGGEVLVVREPPKRADLDVAGAVLADAEALARLALAHRLLAAEPEPQLHDPALDLRELGERPADGLVAKRLPDLFLGGRPLVRDQLAERS